MTGDLWAVSDEGATELMVADRGAIERSAMPFDCVGLVSSAAWENTLLVRMVLSDGAVS